jgi:hypothetical protein
MLEAAVINSIRESIDVELPPRDKDVRLALQASQWWLAAQGLSRSGNARFRPVLMTALASGEESASTPIPRPTTRKDRQMSIVTTKDATQIFYKDWGSGQPIVFSHGWPLSAGDWDTQAMFFLNHGFRVIAHDRRGHGRSTQTSDGHDMDHYADDLAAVTAHLDLKNAIHVGHSTGG